MTHPTLRELTEGVHGLGPRPAHPCAECDRTVARLKDELALLRRADARLRPATLPKPEGGAMKHAIVAAALFAVAIGAVLSTRARPRLAPGETPVTPATAETRDEPTVVERTVVVPIRRPEPPRVDVLDPLKRLLATSDAPDARLCVELCREMLALDPDNAIAERVLKVALMAEAEFATLEELRKLLVDLKDRVTDFETRLDVRVLTPLAGAAPRVIVDALARECRLNVVLSPQADVALAGAPLAFPADPTGRAVLGVLGQFVEIKLHPEHSIVRINPRAER